MVSGKQIPVCIEWAHKGDANDSIVSPQNKSVCALVLEINCLRYKNVDEEVYGILHSVIFVELSGWKKKERNISFFPSPRKSHYIRLITVDA